MQTKADALIDETVPAVAASRGWRRAVVPVALLLGLALADRGGRAAANSGIDPLDVLDLTVKNNILFVLDTSGSMSYASDDGYFNQENGVTDDPTSRSYQAKDAIKQVVASQNGKVNMGLASFNLRNTDKRLVNTGSAAPLLYVSADANATDWVNFFNTNTSQAFANYDQNVSADIFSSLQSGPRPINNNTNTGYPVGCSTAAGVLSPINLASPATMKCRFYTRSRLYRNNTSITWNRAAATRNLGMTAFSAFTCPLPPAGLVGFNPDNNADGFADKPVPCFRLVDSATGRTATFFYSGANFENFQGNACGGAALISAVAPCDDPTGSANTAVINAINKAMNVGLPPDASGKLNIRATGTGSGPGAMEVTTATTYPLAAFYQVQGVTPPDEGVTTTQSTPLGGAIDNVRTFATAHPAGGTGMFPPRPAAAVGLQKNFVILVTDGDDTCEAGANTGIQAINAAAKAQALFYNTKPGVVPTNWNAEPTDPQHQATTFVVAFGVGIAPANANVIAQGGSGAVINTAATTPQTAATCHATRSQNLVEG